MYGVTESTIRSEIRKGTLKARHKKGQVKTWYITQDALEEWASGGMLEEEPEDA